MIYLLRSWPDTPPESVYSLNNQSLTFSLDEDFLSATVVHTGGQPGFVVGQKLTYSELLAIIVREQHVVTL